MKAYIFVILIFKLLIYDGLSSKFHNAVSGVVSLLKCNETLHVTSDRFLSIAIDTGAIQHHWKYVDFGSKRLQALARGLNPTYLRIGGTAADFLTFDPNAELDYAADYDDPYFYDYHVGKFRKKGPKNFTMTAWDWDILNTFASKVGWEMIFDVNVLKRDADGTWDPTNAEVLLKYSSAKGYKLNFELGNEPNLMNRTAHYNMDPVQLGKDFVTFHSVLKKYPRYSSSFLAGPDVTNPYRNGKVLAFFEGVLRHAAPVLHAFTWHHYYFNGHTCTIDDFLNQHYMDSLAENITAMKKGAEKFTHNARLWLGETSAAYGGGAKNLTNTYVDGFLWLDKLGLSAKLGLDVIVRQTFVGGAYALVDEQWMPSPSYWISYIYKQLVGTRVLNITGIDDVRVYAHCTKSSTWKALNAGSVTVFAINLKRDQDVTLTFGGHLGGIPVNQYLLTPHNNNLQSSFIYLNGKKLELHDDNTFPSLIPDVIQPSEPVVLPATRYVFYVFPQAKVPACIWAFKTNRV